MAQYKYTRKNLFSEFAARWTPLKGVVQQQKKAVKHIKIISLILLSALLTVACARGGDEPVQQAAPADEYFVAFWNVENLFDTIDIADKYDEEFTPRGDRWWTGEKLDRKINNLAQVINLMNGGKGPDMLGLSEVENEYVVDLLGKAAYGEEVYGTVHYESPDFRGIDNAILYDKTKFTLLGSSTSEVTFEDDYTTRLILEADFTTAEQDTLHVYVVHFPSRRGGQEESEPRRMAAAATLNLMYEEILASEGNIIVMGDFNDEPDNSSIAEVIDAKPVECAGSEDILENSFFNLSYPVFATGGGSYKYRDDWNQLDQIIVSRALLDGEALDYQCDSFENFKPEALVQKEGKYAGTPLPTFGGRKYLGGFSDHFPVTAVFVQK